MPPSDPAARSGLLPRFGRDFVLYLPSKIIPGLATLISIPIFTRLLSRAEFGRVALVETTVTLGAVALAWTRVSLVRFYPAGERSEAATLVRTAMLVHIVSIALIGAAALAVSMALDLEPTSRALVLLGVALFAMRGPYRFFSQLLRARLDPGGFSTYQSWAAVVAVAAGALLAGLLDLGAVGVVLGSVIGAGSVVPFMSRRALAGIRPFGAVSRDALRQMAGYGLPLSLALLGAWALRRLDRYQIEHFYDASEVGLYSAAYGIGLNSVLLLGAAFRLSSHPLLTTTWETEGREPSRRFLTEVTRLYLLAALPMVAGLTLVAEPTMRLLTRPEFADGWPILPWVAAGAFFLGLQDFFAQTLTLVHRTRWVMLSMLSAATLNALLNWWALPRFGPIAAAVTTLVAYLAACLLVAGATRRFLHWRFPGLSAVRAILAVAVMALVVTGILRLTSPFTAGVQLLAAVPAGALVYGSTLLALRESRWSELRALMGLGRRDGRA